MNDAQFIAQRLLNNMQMLQETFDLLISSTPTGEIRNKIADANIHFGAAQALLSESSVQLGKAS